MDWQQLFDSFKLYDHQVLYNQIHPVSAVQFHSLIDHGQRNLTANVQAMLTNFVTSALFVRRFQETRTKSSMNFDGAANDRLRNLPVHEVLC